MQIDDFSIPLICSKLQGLVLPSALQTKSRESHREFWPSTLSCPGRSGKQEHGQGWVLGAQIHGKGSLLLLAELLENLQEPPRVSALHRAGGPTLLGIFYLALYCCREMWEIILLLYFSGETNVLISQLQDPRIPD